MLWVDPTDPEVIAAVIGEDPEMLADEDAAEIARACAVASEILTMATAHLVHPAGEQTEEFVTRRADRFSPVYGPVTEVVRLVRVDSDDNERPLRFRKVGSTVYVLGAQTYGVQGSVPLWRTNGQVASGPELTVYRLTYRFASTVTPAARQALLIYAREFYLLLTGSDDCQLPANVTSIDREGLGIQLATPQDFLDKGRTGLAKIDTWLSQINSSHATRPSAVYTPDMPPGVPVRRGGVG
jgi:hypothetical protein